VWSNVGDLVKHRDTAAIPGRRTGDTHHLHVGGTGPAVGPFLDQEVAMTTRTTSRIAGAIGAVAAGAAIASALSTGAAFAAPPVVDAFDVEFVDPSCGPGLDAVVALHVRFSDQLLPDGSLHHWIDLDGTVTAGDRVVTLHAARRFTDSATGDSSIFRGLQGQFGAAGAGVLMQTSGWSDDVDFLGRWDGVPTDALPPAVCAYLFG
jgi:hypothetical protein